MPGCAYLLVIGLHFLRHAGRTKLTPPQAGAAPLPSGRMSWLRGRGMGFLSGILNPKNALFYASLAGHARGATRHRLEAGLWMFMAVLLWDLAVAAAIGSQRVLRRFDRALPWLERASGALLMLLALAVLPGMARSSLPL